VRHRQSEIFFGAGMPERPVARYETELVLHRHGGHFTRHVDTLTTRIKDGHEENVSRAVSCVYYFFREPKGFQGGQLRLFEFGGDRWAEIEPQNNSLLVFPSFASHEVVPVKCRSNSVEDSRFTVNCWLQCKLS
jgi:Rps23 Pro-64 3,4-dihydroxylase Tpa1-like proline 4-hydroxylase